MADLRRLKGKVALITGGSSGIGKACVDLFVVHGAKVVSIDLQEPKEPETPYTDGVVFLKASVTDEGVWTSAMTKCEETFGEIPNILVQCAGVPGRASLLDTTMELWNSVFSVNTTAVLRGMQEFIGPLVMAGKPGSICNISSLAGVQAMNAGIAYEASKAACSHMTRSVALDFASKGIRANCVAPGLTITGMTRNSTRPASSKQYMLDRTPIGRWASAEEVAYSILYFVSDEAAYVTGQIFCHDGGYHIA